MNNGFTIVGLNARFVPRAGLARVSARQRGFTLVELVMTIVLVGVITAVTASRSFNTQPFNEYGFFHETISAVRYAQKLAVASCSGVLVQLNANGYALYRAAAAPAGGCNIPCTNPGAVTAVPNLTDPNRGFANNTPSGVAISGAVIPAAIVFCPLGNTLGNTSYNNITIGSRSFSVSGTTGFVR